MAKKKPFYRRWWFYVIIVLLFFAGLGEFSDDEQEVTDGDSAEAEETVNDDESSTEDNNENESAQEEDSETELKTEEESEPEEQPETEPEPEEGAWDDLKENIVGKSDKDISGLSTQNPRDVRNDNTGNWKMSTLSETVSLEEYALSYQNEHMEEDEVHFIVNFAYNTTTSLNDLGGRLYVDITEYEDGEEHDANEIGSGMLLQSYIVYPDGDIEEVEIE